MSSNPIGIFDSGVGGTSIWKEIHQLLPNEDTIYLADSKYAPYGPKGKKRIIELSIKNTELLLSKNCKLIVVACNTATTNAIDYLRKTYDVPFIGIEPAIKPAALSTKTKSIGILATKGTLSSELFHKTSDLYANGIEIIERVGEGLVPLVEEGKIESKEAKTLLKKYIDPMLQANIDYLVLGCTHYPYLIPVIKDLLPEGVSIIDSGEAVAKQTKAVLEQNNLLNTSSTEAENHFYTNDNPEVIQSLIGDAFKAEYLDF
ncbi:glutamate racemase [Winogradskyella sp. 3972H.M.0a.05]|uniref:glutamate racemase n=1 Tax=Winogradskyella sp. 3972H.M.0a.05 TaxID=2950277 RepID=UPI003395A172